MKNKTKLQSAVFGAILATVILFGVGAAPRSAQSWEYHLETHIAAHPDMERFNELGADGWELVSHYTTTVDNKRGFVFKRER